MADVMCSIKRAISSKMDDLLEACKKEGINQVNILDDPIVFFRKTLGEKSITQVKWIKVLPRSIGMYIGIKLLTGEETIIEVKGTLGLLPPFRVTKIKGKSLRGE